MPLASHASSFNLPYKPPSTNDPKSVPYERKQSIDSLVHSLDMVRSNKDFCQVMLTQQNWMLSVKVPLGHPPPASDAK